MYKVSIRQGKGGKFRWMVFNADDGTFVGMSAIKGFEHEYEAVGEAQRLFGGKFPIFSVNDVQIG